MNLYTKQTEKLRQREEERGRGGRERERDTYITIIPYIQLCVSTLLVHFLVHFYNLEAEGLISKDTFTILLQDRCICQYPPYSLLHLQHPYSKVTPHSSKMQSKSSQLQNSHRRPCDLPRNQACVLSCCLLSCWFEALISLAIHIFHFLPSFDLSFLPSSLPSAMLG